MSETTAQAEYTATHKKDASCGGTHTLGNLNPRHERGRQEADHPGV